MFGLEEVLWRRLTSIVLVDTAELSADTITFLTSERRDWLAGRYISSNWDMLEFLKKKDEVVEKDLLKFRMTV